MNKSDLVEYIAKNNSMSSAAAARSLEAVLDAITVGIRTGDGTISISNFGKFTVASMAARTGRNPLTGQPVAVDAKRRVKFAAGLGLKDAANSN